MAPGIEWRSLAKAVLYASTAAILIASIVRMSARTAGYGNLLRQAAENSVQVTLTPAIYDAKRGIIAKGPENGYIILTHPGWSETISVFVDEAVCPSEGLAGLVTKANDERRFVNVQYENSDGGRNAAKSCPQLSGRYTNGQHQAAMAVAAAQESGRK